MKSPLMVRAVLWSIALSLIVNLVGCTVFGSKTENEVRAATLPVPLKIYWISDLSPFGDETVVFHPIEYAYPLIGDNEIYVGVSDGCFFCIRRSDGSVKWKFRTFGGIEASPVANDQMVFIGDVDGQIYAISRDDGSAIWTYRVQGEVLGKISVANDKIFAATDQGRVYAFDTQTGKFLWMFKRAGALIEEQGFAPAGGSAAGFGMRHGSFTIHGIGSPVPYKDIVIAGFDDGYIIALGQNDGKERWKNLITKAEGAIDVDATPVFEDDKLYVPSYDSGMYCLNAENGTVLWSFLQEGGFSRVALDSSRIYFSSSGGRVIALDKKNGQKIWSTDIRLQDKRHSIAKGPRVQLKVPTAPGLLRDTVIAGSSNGYLYVIDQKTGNIRWRFLPGYGLSSEIVSDKDQIFFLSNGGKLYSMGPYRYPQDSYFTSE